MRACDASSFSRLSAATPSSFIMVVCTLLYRRKAYDGEVDSGTILRVLKSELRPEIPREIPQDIGAPSSLAHTSHTVKQ